jgi:HSP20 family protein
MFGLIPWKKARSEGARLPVRMEHPLARMREEMDEFFDRFLGPWPLAFESPELPVGRFWNLEVEETEKEVVLRAEAPGFEAKDFEVSIRGDVLTIHAEHKEEKEVKEGEAPFEARGYREFRRSLTLPAGVDPEKVEAVYRNGILEVKLARLPEAVGKKIEVKT